MLRTATVQHSPELVALDRRRASASSSPTTSPAELSVLVASHLPLYASGLRATIEPAFTDVSVAVVGTGHEAVDAVLARRPHLLVVDQDLPGGNASWVLRTLHDAGTRTHAIVLGDGQGRGLDVSLALQQGLRGLVTRTIAPELFLRCVRTVLNGELWVPRDVLEAMAVREHPVRGTGHSALRPYGLTPREVEVVRALAEGSTNRDIASLLGISEDTVKHHLSSAFDKTGTFSRVELAVFALNHGLS